MKFFKDTYKRIRDGCSFYRLSVKYYLQGDTWKDAKDFAHAIVYNFRRDK